MAVIEFEQAAFHRQLNSEFLLVLETGQTIRLQLAEVSDEVVTRRQKRFSILFRGPADSVLEQHLYNLKHSEMGELLLFLVPVFHDEAGTNYEAVFNQLTDG